MYYLVSTGPTESLLVSGGPSGPTESGGPTESLLVSILIPQSLC